MRDLTVAIVGATGLVGQELVDVLAQRQFPLRELRLYASPRSAGELLACGDVRARVEPLEAASFSDVDLIFLAAGEAVTAEWEDRLESSSAVIIDTSQRFAADSDVPCIVPEVNLHELAEHTRRGIVVSPDATSIALAVVLHPLREALGLRRLVVTTVEPASGAGRAGVDELQRQTVGLMQGLGSDEPGTVFPHRIAFNLFPQIGEIALGAASRDEALTALTLRRLLDQPELPISLTRVRVPLFFGQGLSVNVEAQDPMVTDAVVELLRSAPGILLEDDQEASAYPTPAGAVGQDAVAVGRVRSDTETGVIDLWAVIDNVRKGSAVNAVQIAEALARDHL